MENSAEISPEVECRHCSSPSFWIECLKRFQRWQNQPFTPLSTLPSVNVNNFEDVVNALHNQMLEIERNGQSLQPQLETANTKWSAWKDTCQNYCQKLLFDYQKSRLSVADLQSEINKRQKIQDNQEKYKAEKAEKKRRWTALMEENWRTRESSLKEEFLKDRERKWAEKIRYDNFRNDQQRVDQMKIIWDETQDDCWKGVRLSWRHKWDEEMKGKWKVEKQDFKNEINDELLDWDFAKDFDDLKRRETQGLTPLREQLRKIYQQTEATDLTAVLKSVEEMVRGVERWSEYLKLLSPSASNNLITLAARMEKTMRLREDEVIRISDRRFEAKKEELQKEYDQTLQEMMTAKFQEMQCRFQVEIQQKGEEIEERRSEHYEHLLTQTMKFQQQQFDDELEFKNHEIDEYKTLIEELVENVAEVESKRSKLQHQFQDQTDHVFTLDAEISDLKKSHKIQLAENDVNWEKKLELEKRKHEHDTIALEVKISDEYRTKETYYFRVFEVYKNRLADKTVQLNRLLSDMRRESKRDDNRLGEAREALERALPRLMGTLRELSRIEEDRQRVNRKLEEETRKMSDRAEEEIQSLEEELEKLREKHVAREEQFLRQLSGCYRLEEAINKSAKSSNGMSVNQRMVNMAENAWQRDQLLSRVETSPNGNQQTAETDLENLVKTFNKLFE